MGGTPVAAVDVSAVAASREKLQLAQSSSQQVLLPFHLPLQRLLSPLHYSSRKSTRKRQIVAWRKEEEVPFYKIGRTMFLLYKQNFSSSFEPVVSYALPHSLGYSVMHVFSDSIRST